MSKKITAPVTARRIHWGSAQIAERLGRDAGTVSFLLRMRRLRGAKKVASRWCLSEIAARKLTGEV
jgi:hypothetical protein